MKNKIYHNVDTIPKSNRHIIERGNINTPNTQIHDCSRSWLVAGTLIQIGIVKLVLWVQTSPKRTESFLTCLLCLNVASVSSFSSISYQILCDELSIMSAVTINKSIMSYVNINRPIMYFVAINRSIMSVVTIHIFIMSAMTINRSITATVTINKS